MRHQSTLDLKCVALAAFVLISCVAASAAQTGATKEAPASIMGRVTRDEDNRSSPGIVVALTVSDPSTNFKIVARATTDAEGRYRLAGVAPGRYQLAPVAPAYVVKNLRTGWPPGLPVTVAAGESVEGVDFQLTRGAVITGRVTDADGKPVVAERVEIVPADKKQGLNLFFGGQRNTTDDRGIYRIYGLPAGRYHVSIGQDKESGMVRVGGPSRYYPRTYHPAAIDVTQAQVVELKAGDEATDVDIAVARATKTFMASGRIVSAETGQPVPDLMFGFGSVRKGEKRVGAYGMTGARTNARGEFQVDGLVPGHYAVFAISHDPTDWYSDAAAFEIEDADVGGLEIKLRRGASLSGVVTIEGLSDRAAAAALLPQVQLFAAGGPREELTAPTWSAIKPAPDGTFRISGLRPGKVKIGLSTWRMPKGLSLVRVERDGIEQGEGIEVAEGSQVTGVRVQLSYGTAIVRGQVVTPEGAPAQIQQGTRMLVYARRIVGGQPEKTPISTVETDARGRFLIEGLAAGEYLIVLRATVPGSDVIDVRQTVSVTEGGETSIVLVLK